MDAEQYCKEHWIKNQVWRNLALPHHQRRIALIAAMVTGGYNVEVGCARGDVTNTLRDMCGGVWEGIDQSKAVLDLARIAFPDIEFHYDKPDYVPLDRWFDTVVCTEVIEHVENEAALLVYLTSLAKFKVIITTPCKAVGDPGHLRLYTKESLTDLLTQTGHRFIIADDGRFFYAVIDVRT